jgi:hypothetical protein
MRINRETIKALLLSIYILIYANNFYGINGITLWENYIRDITNQHNPNYERILQILSRDDFLLVIKQVLWYARNHIQNYLDLYNNYPELQNGRYDSYDMIDRRVGDIRLIVHNWLQSIRRIFQ